MWIRYASFLLLAVWWPVFTDAGGPPTAWRLSGLNANCQDTCTIESSPCNAAARNNVDDQVKVEYVLSTYLSVTCDVTNGNAAANAPVTLNVGGTQFCNFQNSNAATCDAVGEIQLCCCSNDANECPVSA